MHADVWGRSRRPCLASPSRRRPRSRTRSPARSTTRARTNWTRRGTTTTTLTTRISRTTTTESTLPRSHPTDTLTLYHCYTSKLYFMHVVFAARVSPDSTDIFTTRSASGGAIARLCRDRVTWTPLNFIRSHRYSRYSLSHYLSFILGTAMFARPISYSHR